MEVVVDALPIPAEALPYRIFAEYKRRSETPSPTDVLLAPGEGLTTPGFVKERARAGEPRGWRNPMGKVFPG